MFSQEAIQNMLGIDETVHIRAEDKEVLYFSEK